MDNIYSLIFKGGRGNTREIAKINSLNDAGQIKTDSEVLSEAEKTIRAFCAERNSTIHYIRAWNQDGITIFDVGSHSEFFTSPLKSTLKGYEQWLKLTI